MCVRIKRYACAKYISPVYLALHSCFLEIYKIVCSKNPILVGIVFTGKIPRSCQRYCLIWIRFQRWIKRKRPYCYSWSFIGLDYFWQIDPYIVQSRWQWPLGIFRTSLIELSESYYYTGFYKRLKNLRADA